jgi:hypothetical protein
MYKASTLKQSASIDDIKAIERLYHKNASEEMIDHAPNDIESKNDRVPLLDLANDLLVEQKKTGFKPSTITFFSEAPEEKIASSVTKATNLKRKVDELTEEVDTDFVAVLHNIPLEILEKVEKHAHKIKKSRTLDLETQSVRRLPIKGN